MTTTTNPHAARERRALEQFGWTPSKKRACPKNLVRRHCQYPRPCLCCPSCGGDNRDHFSRWRCPDGSEVVINEPYNLDPESDDFMDWKRSCEELGLTVTIHEDKTESLWFPGWTTLIVVSRT